MTKFYREIPPLSSGDSFLVFDRMKDKFDFPIHFHPEYEINFILNGKGVKRIVAIILKKSRKLNWCLLVRTYTTAGNCTIVRTRDS